MQTLLTRRRSHNNPLGGRKYPALVCAQCVSFNSKVTVYWQRIYMILGIEEKRMYPEWIIWE